MGKKHKNAGKLTTTPLYYRIVLIKIWIQKFKEEWISQNMRPNKGLDNVVKLGSKTMHDHIIPEAVK